ncbi:MAG: hypothetical protein AVDCRST_MAG19-4798, partial [uncultured Thermomicrobiales bacterium]
VERGVDRAGERPRGRRYRPTGPHLRRVRHDTSSCWFRV